MLSSQTAFSFSPSGPLTSGEQASSNSPLSAGPSSAGGLTPQSGPRRLSQHSASFQGRKVGRSQTSTFPRSQKQELKRPSVLPRYNAADNADSWLRGFFGKNQGLSRKEVDTFFTYPLDPIASQGIKQSARSVSSLPAEVEGDEDLSWDKKYDNVYVVPRRHQIWMNPEERFTIIR